LFRSQGRRRAFWLGFLVCGIATVLVLILDEVFPGSAFGYLVTSYLHNSVNLAFERLPMSLADHFDEHQDQRLAVVDFVPELAAAILGGSIAACLVRLKLTRDAAAPGDNSTSASSSGKSTGHG